MKTLANVNELLSQFEEKFGLPAKEAQQTSEAWLTLKLGVISASNASKLVAKPGSATRETYMAELVAQVATGIMPEISAKPMEWGKDHEDAARSSYEFMTGESTVEVPFVFMDDSFRVGVSPDFLIEGKNKGGEIKCPWNSVHYIQFLTSSKIKPEWDWQCQMTLKVLGADVWDFCQYDPRMKKNPLKVTTIGRDEKKQKTLDDAIPQFISDMDKMLSAAGFTFGEHWLRIAENYQKAV